MSRALLRPAFVLAVIGATAGVLVALGVHWWTTRNTPTEFGWYAYSPLPNAAHGAAQPPSADRWALLWPAAVLGLALGVVVAGALALAGRRIALVSASSPSG